MDLSYFSDLVHTRTVNGRKAELADFDRAYGEVSRCFAWAQACKLDLVAAICRGLITSIRECVGPVEPPY